MQSVTVHTVVAGDRYDGVKIYGERMASVRAAMGRPTRIFDLTEIAQPGSMACVVERCDIVHLHLNERLLQAHSTAWLQLRRTADSWSTPVVVTLHDVSNGSVGEAKQRRNAASLRLLATFGQCVVVSSRHEQSEAARCGVEAHVISHPIFSPDDLSAFELRSNRTVGDGSGWSFDRSLVIAGFVHPGKGIAEFIDSLGDLHGTPLEGWQLRLVGGVTDLHRGHLDDVLHAARRVGLDPHFTGTLSAQKWSEELRRAGVPIACHAHCSASGSLLSWIAHGRRPLSSDHPFARELEEDAPGSIDVVNSQDWRAVLESVVVSDDARTCDLPESRTPESAVEAFDSIVGAVIS